MKKLLLASAAAIALTTSSALAADLARPYYKAPPAPVEAPCVWCGWYIGLNAGWVGSASDNITNSGTDTGVGGLGTALAIGAIPSSISDHEDGFIGGGQIGYNWQISPNWIFGLEADFDGTSAKASRTAVFPGSATFAPLSTTYTRQLDWLSTVRGRLGIAVAPTVLLYGTGGLAIAEDKLGNAFNCAVCGPPSSTEGTTSSTQTKTAAGWTAGAGIEWMVVPHVSLKAEYLYADLGRQNSTIVYTYGANTSSLTSSVRNEFNIVRAGINYHFN